MLIIFLLSIQAELYRTAVLGENFITIYAERLSARFLQNQFFSLRAEELALESLKNHLHQGFYYKIQRMLTDIEQSRLFTDIFKEQYLTSNRNGISYAQFFVSTAKILLGFCKSVGS